jgi:hypothetical protein
MDSNSLKNVVNNSYEISEKKKIQLIYEDGRWYVRLHKSDEVKGNCWLTLDESQFVEVMRLADTILTHSEHVRLHGEPLNMEHQISDDLRVSINWRYGGMCFY